METKDGSIFQEASREQFPDYKAVPCTRWAELTQAMRFHVDLSVYASVRHEFRLLNGLPPVPMIEDGHNPARAQSLFQSFSKNPNGGTPLCRHVNEVLQAVRAAAPYLTATYQRATLIIATDGESSDGDLGAVMKQFQGLPVQVVVRLCTNEQKIVNYWNKIDEASGLHLDVIDDVTNEAREVSKKNPWLNYYEHLQQLRILGYPYQEFDALDERLLKPDEVRVVIAVLLGADVMTFPHPSSWDAFNGAVRHYLAFMPYVWSPISPKYNGKLPDDAPKGWSHAVPLIDLAQLAKCYGPR